MEYFYSQKRTEIRFSKEEIAKILKQEIEKIDDIFVENFYCYVPDCVSGVLTILLNGKTGNAYNIANKNSNVTIREIAEIVSNITGKKIIFELPNDVEKSGYNLVTKSVLNAKKLEALGWNAKYDIKDGLMRTLKILSQIQNIQFVVKHRKVF